MVSMPVWMRRTGAQSVAAGLGLMSWAALASWNGTLALASALAALAMRGRCGREEGGDGC